MPQVFSDRTSFLNVAGGLQGGIVLLGLGLGWISGVHPLDDLIWNRGDLLVGTVAILPMFAVFAFAKRLRDVVKDLLGRPLSRCRWYDLVLLAALAGFGEELLFRGVLQPWIGRIHPWAGVIGANLIFGLLHAVTPLYALVAAAFGFYLSWLYVGYGDANLLRPIVTHALYDYVAFLLLVREWRREPDAVGGPGDEESQPLQPPDAEP